MNRKCCIAQTVQQPTACIVEQTGSEASLAELYDDETVSPAVCLLTPTDAATTARIQAFESLKSEAIRQWQTSARASLVLGAGIMYRLSVAQPQRWWDKADAGVWTSQSFHVDAAATPAASTPDEHVLRRKLDDAKINSVLQAKLTHLQPRFAEKIASTTLTSKARAPRAAAAKLAGENVAELKIAGALGREKVFAEAKRTLLLKQLNTSALNLSFHERRVVQDALSEEATPAPVTTSDVTISFDYCVVDVRRPWLHEGLLRNTAWCVPGVDKGKLSANDGHGLPALPVGFVAIKNLKIKAPWTPEDLTNLQESIQFGPFAFDSDIVDSAVGYPGIQVIGWILQTLPELPPQNVP